MMRSYLDYNATTPLRAEARVAMGAAMDVVGNPSSVHQEGRAAKSLIEKARAQVAAAIGADGADVIFVSSATEGAALALAGGDIHCSEVEHDAVASWCKTDLQVDRNGIVAVDRPKKSAQQLANSETGVIQTLPEDLFLCDATQGFGKIPVAFNWTGASHMLISAHKIGGPKGIGALIVKEGTDIPAQIKGGGQEMGRRSGTENTIGIAGFGAAAAAAAADLASGRWDEIEVFRNILENTLAESVKGTILVGNDAQRLPNTMCISLPGWKGETQVMQMDLSGFAISAGSACSSGKVKESRVLKAMGYSPEVAKSAIRVSLGLETTRAEIDAFIAAWVKKANIYKARKGTTGATL
ncbi:MAG: cysteine desulfurase family protein [Halocynthiibacter sp.]